LRPTSACARDRFRVGSLTKSFVSTVILRLVGEGALTLDDTVEHWLPGQVPNGQAITIRMLLNHTSGLFDYPQDQQFVQRAVSHPRHRWSLATLLAVALAHPPLFAPGTRWSYSNTGYIVLGLIVRRATGQSLASEIRHRILGPLKLHATTFDVRPRMRRPFAHGYLLLGKPPAVDASVWSPSFAGTAGAMVSNARGIAAFYHALFSGRLLPPPLLRQMETTVFAEPHLRYGLGLMRKSRVGGATCGPMWGHDGDFPGYRTDAYSTIDGRRQVVVLVNQMRDMLPPAARRALDAVIATAFCG
jgi:D-alanyl-D-alanine carboxypeptidase